MMARKMVESLKALREAWEDSLEGESLIDAKASIGLVLYDVTGALALSPGQREAVLGARLAAEVEVYLNPPMPSKCMIIQDGERPRVLVYRGNGETGFRTVKRYWPSQSSLQRAAQLAV